MHGPDGAVYPGTCRIRHPRTGPRPKADTLRLDMERALAIITEPLKYDETGVAAGHKNAVHSNPLRNIGDIVLARRDMGTSYHLSVVVDDAAQGISEVVRGADLAEATSIHVILQKLMNRQTPIYHHHRLIRDSAGKRLAKRDDARAILRGIDAMPRQRRPVVGPFESGAVVVLRFVTNARHRRRDHDASRVHVVVERGMRRLRADDPPRADARASAESMSRGATIRPTPALARSL